MAFSILFRNEAFGSSVDEVEGQCLQRELLKGPYTARGDEEVLPRRPVKPLAQVNAPLACRPCEKRLVAFICKESYLVSPVADPLGYQAELRQFVDNALQRVLVGKPGYRKKAW